MDNMLRLGIRYQEAGDYKIDIGKWLIARFAPSHSLTGDSYRNVGDGSPFFVTLQSALHG